LLPSVFSTAPPPTATYTLSLHDALPISVRNPHIQDDTFNFTRCKGLYPLFKGGLHLCGNVEALKIGGKGFGVLWIFLNDQYLFRSEEHTSELQSRENLVCRLLLEKKKST